MYLAYISLPHAHYFKCAFHYTNLYNDVCALVMQLNSIYISIVYLFKLMKLN